MNESRAGRCPADVFHSGRPALEPLHREKLLIAVTSPAAAEVIAGGAQPHGEYVGIYLNLFAAAYNTNLVKADEVPRILRRPESAALEGPARDRGGRQPLVRRDREQARRGRTALTLFQRYRGRRNGTLAAQGPHAARQHGRGRRGAARAHGVQLQVRPAAAGRRADPHVLPAAGDRACRPASRSRVARRIPMPRSCSTSSCCAEAQEILAPRDMVPTNPKVRPPPPGARTHLHGSAADARPWHEVDRALGADHYKAAMNEPILAVPDDDQVIAERCTPRR